MTQPTRYYLTEDDNKKIMVATFKDGAGAAVSLSGATVTLTMSESCSATKIIDAASATPDADQVTNKGVVRFTFLAAHTNTPGDFVAQFKATYGDGTVFTFPYDPIRVRVQRKVAAA